MTPPMARPASVPSGVPMEKNANAEARFSLGV